MLTCGVARSSSSKRSRRTCARCSVAVRGRDLHQPLGAGVRRPAVAEVRLGVDDRRHQRRVEALLARLLADDVLVAQRQRDLLHRVVDQRHDQHDDARSASAATTRPRAAPTADRPPSRGRRRPHGGGRRRALGVWVLTVLSGHERSSFASTSDSARSSSSTVPLFATTYVARAAFSSWES